MKKIIILSLALLSVSIAGTAQTNSLPNVYRSFQVFGSSVKGYESTVSTLGGGIGYSHMFQLNSTGLYLETGFFGGYMTIKTVRDLDDEYNTIETWTDKALRFRIPLYINYLRPINDGFIVYPSLGVALCPSNYVTPSFATSHESYYSDPNDVKGIYEGGFSMIVPSLHLGVGTIIKNKIIASVSYDLSYNFGDAGYQEQDSAISATIGYIF